MSYEIVSQPYLNGGGKTCVKIGVHDTAELALTLEMEGEKVTGIIGIFISFPGSSVDLEIQDYEDKGEPLSEKLWRLHREQILEMAK